MLMPGVPRCFTHGRRGPKMELYGIATFQTLIRVHEASQGNSKRIRGVLGELEENDAAEVGEKM